MRLQAAHAAALRAAEVYTADEHAAVVAALRQIAERWSDAACPESDAEDLHTWIEANLTLLAGDAGKKIHTARSRNDQVATLLSLFCIDAGTRLARQMAEFQQVACRRALDWADFALPMQTHAQFAAPGTTGFWVLRFAAAFDRFRRQLSARVTDWRQWCPLGSGAVAGSSIPIDRRIQARELGYTAPSPNALYSTSTRDECIELLAVAAQASLHLGAFAADVIGFAQTPFAWAIYPKAFATGSSMMPNKRNPDAMELLRGECAGIAAAHGQALGLMKGLPSGYNRDLQCIKPLVCDAVARLMKMLTLATDFLRRLEFDAAQMSAAMAAGGVGATLRMEQLVQGGRPLREAHHAVAIENAAGALPVEFAGPDSVRRYRTLGSANPSETRRIAGEWLAELEKENLS